MGTTLIGRAARVFSCNIVSLPTTFAEVHIVVFAKSELLVKVCVMALLSLFPCFRLQITSSITSDYLLPLLELKTGTIELEYSHDCLSIQDTVLQISILLPVEILRALWIHIVQHMLAQVGQIGVQVTWVCLDNIVNQEGQELFL